MASDGVGRDGRVVVVGAGAAGLAAARRLREGGLDPLVLEARGRIGGRAYTVEVEGMRLDRGCGWLHSADTNPWVALAREAGLTVDGTPSPWRRQFGNLNFPAHDQAAYAAASDAFEARVEDAARRGEEGPAALWLEPGNRWNPLLDAISSYYNGTEFGSVSITDYFRYNDSGTNWRVREGYGTAVARFGRDVPVRLGEAVSRIDHDGPRLRLHTGSGVVEADRAVLTVPPSVFAAGGVRLHPAVPAKEAAAAGLPLGMANKVFLAVTEPDALPREAHAFGRPDRTATASYHFQPFGRPVVEGYFGGACARALEAEGEAAFVAYALAELEGLLGTEVRRALRPLLTTAWAGDPFARGAYSHALPGHADDRAVWAAPVEERLFFAGEACSTHDFSTAHGAYRTGREAAAAVLGSLGLPVPP